MAKRMSLGKTQFTQATYTALVDGYFERKEASNIKGLIATKRDRSLFPRDCGSSRSIDEESPRAWYRATRHTPPITWNTCGDGRPLWLRTTTYECKDMVRDAYASSIDRPVKLLLASALSSREAGK